MTKLKIVRRKVKHPKNVTIKIVAKKGPNGEIKLTAKDPRKLKPKKRKVLKIIRKKKRPTKQKVITRTLSKEEHVKYNKALCRAFYNNNAKGVIANLLAGGSIAYGNFDGISDASQEGNIEVFEAMFEKLDPTSFLTKEIINDCIFIADDPELKNEELVKYLKDRVHLLPDTLENENMNGFEAGED